MKATRVVFIVLLFAIGCKQGEDKNLLKKEYYPDGAIKTKTFRIDGDDKHVLKKEYFRNGKLKHEITYIINDTTRDGSAIYYYKSGQLGDKCFYLKGRKDGSDTDYYENGVIEEIGMYWSGKGLGSFYYYYPNGKIETYNASDADSDFNVHTYDLSGKRKYEWGRIVSLHVSTTDGKTKRYVVNDTLMLAFQIAEPPDFRTQVKIGLYKVEGEKRILIDTFKDYQRNQWSQAVYEHRFNTAGNYEIACIGQMFDTLNKTYSNWDSVFIEHTVYER
jgi:antitoxin component YwqK of YwqJK toxin-antitoxin module